MYMKRAKKWFPNNSHYPYPIVYRLADAWDYGTYMTENYTGTLPDEGTTHFIPTHYTSNNTLTKQHVSHNFILEIKASLTSLLKYK